MDTAFHQRTVSGSLASVRGRLVLEVELAGQYYVHQFMVMDIEEDIILGLTKRGIGSSMGWA